MYDEGFFRKIVNGLKQLAFFQKSSIKNIWIGPKYPSVYRALIKLQESLPSNLSQRGICLQK